MKHRDTPLFIVVEGIDGSGKSSLCRNLAAAWSEKIGSELKLLREPTDGPSGRTIRAHLQRGERLPRHEWLELFFADRAWNLEHQVEPALAAGISILQDRYFWSTAAYQGDVDKSPSPEEIVAESLRRGFRRADLVVYLSIPVESALQRIAATRDHFESFENGAALSAIARRFDQLLPDEALRLDATLSESTLCELTMQKITALYERRYI